jgi:hypothetical protein
MFLWFIKYEVCVKSNEIGAIIFFIDNYKSTLSPPKSFPWEATHCSSAGSLHMGVPSAGLSRPFRVSKITFDVEFEFREKEKDLEQSSMGAAEPLEFPFWDKNSFTEMAGDRKRRDAASKCRQYGRKL